MWREAVSFFCDTNKQSDKDQSSEIIDSIILLFYCIISGNDCLLMTCFNY